MVHAICIWSSGADCGGKSWVIVPLETQNNGGRPGCFQNTIRLTWHFRETWITGAAQKQADPREKCFELNKSRTVLILR